MKMRRWFDVYVTMLNGVNAIEPAYTQSSWRFVAAALTALMCGLLSINVQLANQLGEDDR